MTAKKKGAPARNYSPAEVERRRRYGTYLKDWNEGGGSAKLGEFKPYAASMEQKAGFGGTAPAAAEKPKVVKPAQKAQKEKVKRSSAVGPDSKPPQPPKPPGADPDKAVRDKAKTIPGSGEGLFAGLLDWLR